ncbi:MAG: M23 family metallopeptidase, partial [Bacteroidetes bacterium]|nr:M23 family metallopeptidase [Bacteroidota bacterium]
MYLSGNFCQIRDGHFHYGLDLPTNNAEGWPIRAIADGYISRIFVASYGYGNALFITHPNGLMSVYAHLRNFNETLADYTLNQHYKKQSNSLDIFPKKNLLKVKKGDIIAYSGNSGGSTGPHLHFEIRNSKNELLNPQSFFDIPDTMPPVIGEVRLLHNKLHSAENFQDSGFIQGDT